MCCKYISSAVWCATNINYGAIFAGATKLGCLYFKKRAPITLFAARIYAAVCIRVRNVRVRMSISRCHVDMSCNKYLRSCILRCTRYSRRSCPYHGAVYLYAAQDTTFAQQMSTSQLCINRCDRAAVHYHARFARAIQMQISLGLNNSIFTGASKIARS